jgi:hypothetical protein
MQNSLTEHGTTYFNKKEEAQNLGISIEELLLPPQRKAVLAEKKQEIIDQMNALAPELRAQIIPDNYRHYLTSAYSHFRTDILDSRTRQFVEDCLRSGVQYLDLPLIHDKADQLSLKEFNRIYDSLSPLVQDFKPEYIETFHNLMNYQEFGGHALRRGLRELLAMNEALPVSIPNSIETSKEEDEIFQFHKAAYANKMRANNLQDVSTLSYLKVILGNAFKAGKYPPEKQTMIDKKLRDLEDCLAAFPSFREYQASRDLEFKERKIEELSQLEAKVIIAIHDLLAVAAS